MSAKDLSPVDMDRGQIGQVIQNLVLNADQTMPDGGVLKVSAENVEIPEDGTLSQEAGGYVAVTVQDEGIGMPQSVRDRIFDPYFTTKEAGHGLGLSIAHTIISNHGGRITVTSEVEDGTAFEILLPASTGQGPVADETEAGPLDGSGRILLMDDEETVLETVSRMLVAFGYEVGLSSDGDEALEAYKAAMDTDNPYDLVVMDLTIPGGMGGKEAVTKLLQMHPEARVVVSSGYSNDPVMGIQKTTGS